MTISDSPNFAFFGQGDAYSTARKLMGRQAAGKAFIGGIARTWPEGRLEAVVQGKFNRGELVGMLAEGGFRGQLGWSQAPAMEGAVSKGALYFPAPLSASTARLRNRLGPSTFSIMGVTHTLSSDRSHDLIASMIQPPFKPWDALICTSTAALNLVQDLFDETREDWISHGVTQFNAIQTPVIPLGVHCDARLASGDARAEARRRFDLAPDEVVVLFAGRLLFHGKANPAAMYRAMQAVAKDAKLVCIEAGQHATPEIKLAFADAQQTLAPDVRFIHAPGEDNAIYDAAWRAADIFCSLSDNIQETFGLTPVEAMAAGLPVLVTDWNGYRDNVRDGLDGFLIPTLAAPAGAGADIAVSVEIEQLSYDRLIGISSLGVAVDARVLQDRLRALATDANLRASMGASGRARARSTFDWPVVLRQYEALAVQLEALRRAAPPQPPQDWPQRTDPFRRFAHFATRTIAPGDMVTLAPDAAPGYRAASRLGMTNFGFDDVLLPKAGVERMLRALHGDGGRLAVATLLDKVGGATPVNHRALAWLAKCELVEISAA